MGKNKKRAPVTEQFTMWLGTPISIVVHTIVFTAMFLMPLFGMPIDQMLLILTTMLSIEAIYLALFIQMSVNRASESLEEVEESLEEVEEDIGSIERDIDTIERDIDTIQEDEKKDDAVDVRMATTISMLDKRMEQLQKQITQLSQLKAKEEEK